MADTHNIFLSWSKPQARAAALAIRDWLPRVIQACKPWMSETDIEKGKPWLDELMGALGGLKLGIVCLTREGLSEPWVLFEVGVICKALPETRIWTYLLGGLRHSDVPNPLGIFQHTVATKEDTLRLLRSVNQAMGERAISEEILKDEFELRWKELDDKLRDLPIPTGPVRTGRTNEEMFREIVETVRAGAAGGKAIEQIRDEVHGLQNAIAQVMEILHPSPFFGGPGFRGVFSGLGGREVNVLNPLGPNWGEANATVVSPVLGGAALPRTIESSMLTPGSPTLGGHVAVPQPRPLVVPESEQAKKSASTANMSDEKKK